MDEMTALAQAHFAGYLTTIEAAAILKVTDRRVRQLIAAGELKGAIRRGDRWEIRRAAVLELAAARNSKRR